MSKTSSGLFSGTKGARAGKPADSSSSNKPRPSPKPQAIDPNEIRYSQNSVNGSEEIIKSMQENGWQGDPIDVVRMADGKLTTLDNTRVVAARVAGIDVKAIIHEYNDPLPSQAAIERFTTPKGGAPRTWGRAVENRIGRQSSGFRRNNPKGSYNIGRIR